MLTGHDVLQPQDVDIESDDGLDIVYVSSSMPRPIQVVTLNSDDPSESECDPYPAVPSPPIISLNDSSSNSYLPPSSEYSPSDRFRVSDCSLSPTFDAPSPGISSSSTNSHHRSFSSIYSPSSSLSTYSFVSFNSSNLSDAPSPMDDFNDILPVGNGKF